MRSALQLASAVLLVSKGPIWHWDLACVYVCACVCMRICGMRLEAAVHPFDSTRRFATLAPCAAISHQLN